MDMGGFDFYAPIRDFLSWLNERSREKNASIDAAIVALQEALLETKRYEESLNLNGQADRDREFELAKLWNRAAAVARKANNELAMRLGEKARYWSDEVKWSSEEVAQSGISLRSIENELSQLLRGQ